jgi:hypothetical protein
MTFGDWAMRVVLYEARAGGCVDTLLLSCRVLGRGGTCCVRDLGRRAVVRRRSSWNWRMCPRKECAGTGILNSLAFSVSDRRLSRIYSAPLADHNIVEPFFHWVKEPSAARQVRTTAVRSPSGSAAVAEQLASVVGIWSLRSIGLVRNRRRRTEAGRSGGTF